MSNFSQIGLSHWSTIIVSYYSNTGTRDLVALFWPAPSILFWTRETIRSNYHHSILNCNKVIKHTYLATLMYKHGKRINQDPEYRKMDLLPCLWLLEDQKPIVLCLPRMGLWVMVNIKQHLYICYITLWMRTRYQSTRFIILFPHLIFDWGPYVNKPHVFWCSAILRHSQYVLWADIEPRLIPYSVPNHFILAILITQCADFVHLQKVRPR